MALCKANKYSIDEIQRFNDTINNILLHDDARNDLRHFLTRIRRNDLKQILNRWEEANDIKRNTPGTPERRRKTLELEEKMEEEEKFDEYVDENMNLEDKVNVWENWASEQLSKVHEKFVKYLRKKYK